MATDAETIVDTFLRYSKAFESLDATLVAPFYHEPSVLISSQGVVAFPNHAEVTRFFDRLLGDLRRDGYSKSSFIDLKALALSDTLAIVNGTGIWSRGDDSELGDSA